MSEQEPLTTRNPPMIIGFVCEWAGQLDDYLQADGFLTVLPTVQIVKVPCSGYIKPAWVQEAIQQGWDGAFVCGCAMVDCHYREGNIFLRDRMTGDRNPYLRLKGGKGGRRGVDPRQVRSFWHAGTGGESLIRQIHAFAEDLTGGSVPLGELKPVRRHPGPVLDVSPLNPTGPEPEPAG